MKSQKGNQRSANQNHWKINEKIRKINGKAIKIKGDEKSMQRRSCYDSTRGLNPFKMAPMSGDYNQCELTQQLLLHQMYGTTQNHPQLRCHYDRLTSWLTCSLAGWLASWLAQLACRPALGAAQKNRKLRWLVTSSGWRLGCPRRSVGAAGVCNKQSTWSGWHPKNPFCVFITVWHTREKSQDVTNSVKSARSKTALNCDIKICSVTHNDTIKIILGRLFFLCDASPSVFQAYRSSWTLSLKLVTHEMTSMK